MNRVFIVNEPLRKNDVTGELEKFLPLESAAKFGEVVKLTPDGSPPGNIAPWLKMINDGLEGWQDGDYLVLVGDQALLAYAASIVGGTLEELWAAARDEASVPKFRVLKWERRQYSYSPLTLESA